MLKRILFATLVFAWPSIALAAFASFQAANTTPPPSTIFQGDSTKSISSITPSITCLQSGTLQTPAFIQCSADGTTASGSSNPFIDLQYVWTDNNVSPDTFTLPIIGTRSSSLQNGPLYTQVFRSAGTYTITLTVSGCTSGHPSTAYAGGGGACNGNAITTAQTTQSVTVAAWTGTDYFFDTATGSDSNACSSGAKCLTPNKCISLLDAASNRRCNFNCGQTFDGTVGSGLRLSSSTSWSHGRVVSGGSACPGSPATIQVSSGSNSCIAIQQNGAGGVKSDIVISGINCLNNGSSTAANQILIAGNNTGGGSLNEVYLDTIGVTSTVDNSSPFEGVNTSEDQATIASTFQGVVLWNVSTTSPATATGGETGILGGTQGWYSVVGGTQQGSGAFDDVRSHDVYMHCGGHCMARWINTGPTCSGAGCTPTRDLCVKTSYDQADGDGSAFTSSYWLITENYCESTAAITGPGNNTNNPSVSTIDQYIVQQNVGFEISGGLFPATAQNMVVRDNWSCLTGPNAIGVSVGQFFNGAADGTAEDSVLISNIYRNFVYNNSTGATGAQTLNYDYNPDTWTNPQRIFDNIMQTDSSAGILFNIPSSNFTSVGSFIDYDTYYAPNHASAFLNNASASVTFAAWKALSWDTHGVNANPGFSSPSTCGFGSWPY